MPQHAYGWHPSPPDDRDFVYKVRPHVSLAALPPKVDLSQPALPAPYEPSFDQGALGSCGPNSAAADIIFAALRQQSLPSCPMPSRLFIYYATRMLMGTEKQDSGVNNRTMLKALAKYGWADEADWPYHIRRFKERPPQSVFGAAAKRKIVKYEAVPQDLQTMKAALAGGDTFIFGFSVYSSMETAEVERTGIVPYPSSRDRFLGGHDVAIVAYDDATQRFTFKNSWGEDWGKGGYGEIDYRYATNPHLSQDFRTVTHSALTGDIPVNPDIKSFLSAVRAALAMIAKLTPNTYDDLLVAWLDWVLGDGPMPTERHEALGDATGEEDCANALYSALSGKLGK